LHDGCGVYTKNARLSELPDCPSTHRSQHGVVSRPFGFTLPGSSGDDSADLHLPIAQSREGNASCWWCRLFLSDGSDGTAEIEQ
jgi:hypothetical protein